MSHKKPMLTLLAICLAAAWSPAAAIQINGFQSGVSLTKSQQYSKCDDITVPSLHDTKLVDVTSAKVPEWIAVARSDQLSLRRIVRSSGPCGDRIFGFRPDTLKFDSGATLGNQSSRYKSLVDDKMFPFNADVPLPLKGAHNVIMLTPTATTTPASLHVDSTQMALVKSADGWMIFKVDSTNSASPPQLLLTSSRRVKSVTYSLSGSTRLVTIVVAAPSGVDAVVFAIAD